MDHPVWIFKVTWSVWQNRVALGLHQILNCRFKRQNLNRSSAAWVWFDKCRMNNCRFKRQNLNWSSAAWVWFGKWQMNNCRFKRQNFMLGMDYTWFWIVVLNDKTCWWVVLGHIKKTGAIFLVNFNYIIYFKWLYGIFIRTRTHILIESIS